MRRAGYRSAIVSFAATTSRRFDKPGSEPSPSFALFAGKSSNLILLWNGEALACAGSDLMAKTKNKPKTYLDMRSPNAAHAGDKAI
jgi:hypothetical protein